MAKRKSTAKRNAAAKSPGAGKAPAKKTASKKISGLDAAARVLAETGRPAIAPPSGPVAAAEPFGHHSLQSRPDYLLVKRLAGTDNPCREDEALLGGTGHRAG